MALHDLRFERYELHVVNGLGEPRHMVGEFDNLAGAQKVGDGLARRSRSRHYFVSVEYIGLFGNGREEKIWVRVIGTGEWKQL